MHRVWLREVCERGLLSRRVVFGTQLCIAAAELGRVAEIVRLGHGWGVDLDTIALLLQDSETIEEIRQ